MANSTLRLTEEHEAQLSAIAKMLGTKGKNDTITRMIETFAKLKTDLENTEKLCFETLRQKQQILAKVQNFQNALQELSNIKTE